MAKYSLQLYLLIALFNNAFSGSAFNNAIDNYITSCMLLNYDEYSRIDYPKPDTRLGLSKIRGGSYENVNKKEFDNNANCKQRKVDRHAMLNDYRAGAGSNRDFTLFGKDMELVHCSIDLRWFFRAITDKQTWLTILNTAIERIRRLSRGYEEQLTYREKAIELLLNIRYFDPDSDLRIFRYSLDHAEDVAFEYGRFVVLYIEDEATAQSLGVSGANFRSSAVSSMISPSIETTEYRRALANPELAALLNDKFIFMPATSHHPYARRLVRQVEGENTALLQAGATSFSFPFFLVLAPSRTRIPGADEISTGGLSRKSGTDKKNRYRNQQRNNKKRIDAKSEGKSDPDALGSRLSKHKFDILASLRLSRAETNAANIRSFLEKVLTVHKFRFERCGEAARILRSRPQHNSKSTGEAFESSSNAMSGGYPDTMNLNGITDNDLDVTIDDGSNRIEEQSNSGIE